VEVTLTAASAIEQARQANGIPPSHGVRIFAAKDPKGEVMLALDFAAEPSEGDDVTEQYGTRLFLAADVAGPLADVELDAIPDVSADGDQAPRLVFRPRGGPDGDPEDRSGG
jgi:hypothetical protein